ncbi:MAG: hypothetical protein ACREFE_20195 [Limisphaerales bacterium]
MSSLTPRWSQRRLLLYFTFHRKFTLAVIRAVAQLWIVRRLMYSLDYTTLLAYGFIGFSIAAAISGSIYTVASYIARSLSPRQLHIYLYRLGLLLVLSFLWLLWCAFRVPTAFYSSNALLPDSWYRYAWDQGIAHGTLSSAAWIIVALIDWPKHAKPPNTALEPTATAL